MRRNRTGNPSNIQSLINQNEMRAQATAQIRAAQIRENETRFREAHNSYVHNAEVRRNIKRTQEEVRIARLELVAERRARLAKLIEEEKKQWENELLQRGLTVTRL
ncbi:hypothetical protein GPJ56_003737 [Histomonas meleagridis]|uniref:uncharacterized protein n=1 Tax=Histomonas meleagridis TaxID=135588 RepID=UPI00355AA4A7|nr:hypothetical protein GPJ56_003737 [Histomonas meleagridis]KAH0805195.1 hypothetical protein GO595_002140 [Histomonas meleagridis]